MTQEIRFGDVELAVVNRVRARLVALGDTATVGTRVPNPRPARFVTVRRTGGPITELHVTEWAQVTLEAWAASDFQAHLLAQTVRAIVASMPGRVWDNIAVYRMQEFSGPANLPDPESAQSRYTWTVSLHVRAIIVADVPA